MDQKDLSALLFESEALKVSPVDKPFWYTSGTFGPYFLNTHFVYGGMETAERFLSEIERARTYPEGMANRLYRSIDEEMQRDKPFRELITMLCEKVIALDFDIISGGERRDYYFSIPLAAKLNLPHVSILKDGRCYLSEQHFTRCRELEPHAIDGQKVLHVADLLTQGSSYLRAWLPAIERIGGKITDTAVVVSRLQGGEEALAKEGVETHALLPLTPDFFEAAVAAGHLREGEKRQILRFMEDPEAYMAEFLKEHPDFLEKSAAENSRNKERVERFKREYPELLDLVK